jgi:hypothetical protein
MNAPSQLSSSGISFTADDASTTARWLPDATSKQLAATTPRDISFAAIDSKSMAADGSTFLV